MFKVVWVGDSLALSCPLSPAKAIVLYNFDNRGEETRTGPAAAEETKVKMKKEEERKDARMRIKRKNNGDHVWSI